MQYAIFCSQGLTPGLTQQPIYSLEDLQLLQQQQRLLVSRRHDKQ